MELDPKEHTIWFLSPDPIYITRRWSGCGSCRGGTQGFVYLSKKDLLESSGDLVRMMPVMFTRTNQ